MNALIERFESRRYFATYGLDRAFGEEGMAFVSTLSLLEYQEDEILAGGASNRYGLLISRLRADGQLDPDFGVEGQIRTKVFASVNDVDASETGIYASGSTAEGTSVQFLRYSSDGELIGRFGSSGVATIAVPIQSAGRSLYFSAADSIQADDQGRLYFSLSVQEKAGKAKGVYDRYVYVGRLTASGKLDRTYGQNGFVRIEGDYLVRFEVDSKHRAVVQTQTAAFDLFPPQRLTEGGEFDSTFNSRIRAVAKSLGTAKTSVRQVTGFQLDAFDRVVLSSTVYGRVSSYKPQAFVLVRTTDRGLRDAGFGVRGQVAPAIEDYGSINWLMSASGEIYVDSRGYAEPVQRTVFRYSPDGVLGETFAVAAEVSGGLRAVGKDSDFLAAAYGGFANRVISQEDHPAVLGSSGKLYLYGTNGNDTVTVSRNGSQITAAIAGRSFSFNAGAVNAVHLRAYGGLDRVTIGADLNTTIERTDGGDTLTTAGGNDLITHSLDADGYLLPPSTLGDVIRSGDGDDTIFTWDGNDDIRFGDGNTNVAPGNGNDTVAGGTGRFVIGTQHNGGTKTITLQGGGGELILGNDDDVVTIHGADDYYIDVGKGRNRVTSGSGNDTIVSDGFDTLDGGAGNDRIEESFGNDIDTDHDLIRGGLGNDEIYFSYSRGRDSIYGDGGNDTITCGADGVVVSGGDGNDVIASSTFAGDDVLNGDGGNDTIESGPGNDVVRGGIGNDLLRGGANKDKLFGGDGADTLDGGGGNDQLYGETGDDLLIGGAGADALTGGSGADRAETDTLDLLLDDLTLV